MIKDHVDCTSRIEGLKTVGEHFNECLRRYVVECRRSDFPWRYSERPLVGVVSAAVWGAGGICLEEYWTKKRKSGGKSYGRIDLFFKIKGTGYIAEAKHRYINVVECLGDWRRPLIEQSIRDSRSNMLRKGEKAVGLAFWSIRYSRKDHPAGVDEEVKMLVEELRKCDEADLTLWHFPGWAVDGKHCSGERNVMYAGLVMQMFVNPNP